MYCGTNKTAVSSQRQISQTMLALLAEKPYEEITICELCKAAGVSRQTFYSLFTSRENVIVFTLQEAYCYAPDESALTHPAPGCCSLRMLCRGYSDYILQNRDFLRLLVANHIDYLLYDSIFEALNACDCFFTQEDEALRLYAVSFFAGGISSIARSYAAHGCRGTARDLENLLYTFFAGRFFAGG